MNQAWINALNGIGQTVWKAALMQAYIDRWIDLMYVVIFIVAAVISRKSAIHLWRKVNDDLDLLVVASGVMWLIFFGFIVATLVFGYDAIVAFTNPQYHALTDILSALPSGK